MEIWVALPDSSLVDEDTLQEKSRKVAIFARILAIFRVSRVIIYHDQSYNGDDARLLKLILEFMNTPPYLRRLLYKRVPELRYAGLFEPLNAPHHKEYKRLDSIKVGDIRQGLVIRKKDMLYVEVGLDQQIPLDSYTKDKVVNIIFTSPYPNLRCRIAKEEEIKEYWGYDVIFYSKLSNILESFNDLIILTSRKGKMIYEYEKHIRDESKKSKRIIIVFGSTKKGIHEILASEGYNKHLRHVYNFFPNQGVKSIRIEEAMLGTLSILNYILSKEF